MDNLLNAQKAMIRKNIFAYIGLCIFFLVLLPLYIYMITEFVSINFMQSELSDSLLYLVPSIGLLILFPVAFVWFIIRLVECIKVHRGLKSIYFMQEEIREMLFIKAKTFFMSAGSHKARITGFILTDINKNKYYYVLPEDPLVRNAWYNSTWQLLRPKLLFKKIPVTFYKGTNLIRDIRLDMYEHGEDMR